MKSGSTPNRPPLDLRLVGLACLFVVTLGFGAKLVEVTNRVENLRSEVTQNVGLLVALDRGTPLEEVVARLEIADARRLLLNRSIPEDTRRQEGVDLLRRANRQLSMELGDAWTVLRWMTLASLLFAAGSVVFATLLVYSGRRRVELEQVVARQDGAKVSSRRQEALVRQLESTNERLERFAMALSHDLKAPLRNVVAHVEQAQRAAPHPALEHAHRSAMRMAAMMSGMLQIARAGRELSLYPVELDEVAAEAVHTLKAELEAAGGEVEIGPLTVVTGNRMELIRVFQNVLNNALTYQHADRPLRVSISAQQEGAMVHVVVADNGRGISESDAKRVFGLFVRAADFEHGAGVGLALCRSIVRSAGGKIWMVPGDEGVEVHLTLRSAV